MMIEAFMTVVNFIFGLLLVVVAGFFAYMSSVLVSEKKARQRAGLTDYYDRPIGDANNEASVETNANQQKSNATSTTKTGVFDKSKVKYFDGDNT